MAWVVSSRRRRNDVLIYPVLRSSESITDGELHNIVFKIDAGCGEGASAGEGGLLIKIGKAETIPCADEESCYRVNLYATRETIVKPIVIAQELVGAGVAGAVLTAVGLDVEQIGCCCTQLDLKIFCDVEGHHLCEHEVVEVYGPVDAIILIIKSMSGIEQFGMRADDPLWVGGKESADVVAGPGAAVDGGGVGDIGEVKSRLDANADGMVFLFDLRRGWLIGLAGLLAEQGERQEHEQDGRKF